MKKIKDKRNIDNVFFSIQEILVLKQNTICGIINKSSGDGDGSNGSRRNPTGCSAVW